MATKKQLEEEILLFLKEIKKEREEFSLITHEEHDFLRELIEERRQNRETWQAIKIKVLSNTAWGLWVALGLACALSVKQWVTST